MFFEFLLIISTNRASISALSTLRSCLTLNIKDSSRNNCYITTFTDSPYLVNAFILWNFKKMMIHWVIWAPGFCNTLNSSLSVINRLRKLSKFFCKLLIFRCSIEKLLWSKLFKFCEDSSGVKYCQSLKLNALKKFSAASWLSLFSIFWKSKFLNTADSKSAFLALVFIWEPMS